MRALVGVRSSPHRVDPADEGIEPYRWHANLPDRVAIEAALQTADEVVVAGIDGDSARDAVRAGLRMGADEGVQVVYDPIEEAIGEKYARVLARTAGRERADALFVGQSAPMMGPEVTGMAAEVLDWPAVSRVTAIGADAVAADADGPGLPLQRKLGVGKQEVVTVEPPAVVGVDGSFGNPRRAPLDAVIAGGRAEIRTVDLESVAPSESRFSMSIGNATVESVTSNERWGRGRPPQSGGVEERIRRMLGRDAGGDDGGEILDDVSPEEAADRVVDYLEEHDLL
jgi:electron transfer flavoprotein alpha/beta subunit